MSAHGPDDDDRDDDDRDDDDLWPEDESSDAEADDGHPEGSPTLRESTLMLMAGLRGKISLARLAAHWHISRDVILGWLDDPTTYDEIESI